MKRGFKASSTPAAPSTTNRKPPDPRAFSGPALRVVLGVVAALGAFWMYLRTLAPTVLYFDPDGLYDSVMLQVKAHVLGIPNPTGYPTYAMLTHLFTYLPFGDVGYRVNLASAVFGAVAVFLVFAGCRLLTGRLAPAVAAALLFGFSRAFWGQATIAEVYTLNALFVAAVILALFAWRKTGRDGHLLLSAFLLGLSMTHHMTSGLLLPAALLFVGMVDPRKLLQWRLALKGAGLFLLGLLPYAYLPIRASADPPLNEWDPDTPGRFFDLVTGNAFAGRMFSFAPSELPGRFQMYLKHLEMQFDPVFLSVAALGVLYLLARDRAALAMLAFLYAGWLFYALEYDIKDIHLYFIPTYLVLCFFVAAGLGAVLDLIGRSIGGTVGRVAVGGLSVLAVAAVLAGPFSTVDENHRASDRSDNFHGLHMINAVVEAAPEGATVLHNNSELWYMRYVGGRREDLDLVDPFPPGGWSGRTPVWTEAARERLDGGRVFIFFPDGSEKYNADFFEKAGLRLIEDENRVLYEVVPEREGR